MRALAWQASFLRQSGRPDAALEYLDRADTLCSHPDVDVPTRLFEQAFIAYQRGYCLDRRDNERALACFHESVKLWEAYGDPWWAALGLGGLGFMLSWSNHFIEARTELSKSVDLFERYGHIRELIFLHNRLSDSCKFKGEMAAARAHAERALALSEQSGNKKGMADALRNLATIMVATESDRQRAEQQNQEALALYRSLGVQVELALSVTEIGKHRLFLGEADAALHSFQAAKDLFKAQQLRQGEGYALHWLAIAAATKGQQREAKAKIERSIAIFAEVGADNYIPHLQVIRYLIDKEALPLAEARPWLAGILRNALDIHEFYDVYWSLSALAYVLLSEESAAPLSPLPPAVHLAAAARGFLGASLEFGRSAYMRALVLDEVDAMLAPWPQPAVDGAKAEGGQQEVWTFAKAVLDSIAC